MGFINSTTTKLLQALIEKFFYFLIDV